MEFRDGVRTAQSFVEREIDSNLYRVNLREKVCKVRVHLSYLESLGELDFIHEGGYLSFSETYIVVREQRSWGRAPALENNGFTCSRVC